MASVQLRRYVLPLDHAEQDRWIEWWRGISAPRALYGFTIPFAVLDRGTGEFTWTVQHESDDFDTVGAVSVGSGGSVSGSMLWLSPMDGSARVICCRNAVSAECRSAESCIEWCHW